MKRVVAISSSDREQEGNGNGNGHNGKDGNGSDDEKGGKEGKDKREKPRSLQEQFEEEHRLNIFWLSDVKRLPEETHYRMNRRFLRNFVTAVQATREQSPDSFYIGVCFMMRLTSGV